MSTLNIFLKKKYFCSIKIVVEKSCENNKLLFPPRQKSEFRDTSTMITLCSSRKNGTLDHERSNLNYTTLDMKSRYSNYEINSKIKSGNKVYA